MVEEKLNGSYLASRRRFLKDGMRLTAGAFLAELLGGWVGDLQTASAVGSRVPHTCEVEFYEPRPGKQIQCFVCPLNCVLEDGETCFCRTRTNVGGKLYSTAYNNPCIVRTDPIEKLPLNHFTPGARTLTLATGGCNLRCLYCQNWQQSQTRPQRLKNVEMTAEQAATGARRRQVPIIAFGYTEPVVFLEWAKEVAQAAKQRGIRVVVATAAFVNPKPIIDFAQYVDGFCAALKGFDEQFYRVVLGSKLKPTLKALEAIRSTGKWMELTTLIVPGYNDDMKKIRLMCHWVKRNLGSTVPLHFARFVPEYRLRNLPRTPVRTLEDARKIALDVGLKYVYTSNVAPHVGNNTYCPSCGRAIIERVGFKLIRNNLKNGRCPNCGYKLPGVWS